MERLLESQAAGLAAERADADDIARLEQRHRDLAAAYAVHDPRPYLRANVAFSIAVHIAAHSEPLREVLRIVAGQAMRFRFLAYQRSETFTDESLADAGRILEAIASRDASRAEQLTAALLQRSWDEIARLLRTATPVAGQWDRSAS